MTSDQPTESTESTQSPQPSPINEQTLEAVLKLKPATPVQSPMDSAEEENSPHRMLKHANSNSVMPISAAKAPSIARYFGIEVEADIGPETKQLLSSLGEIMFQETSDADEIFMFMKAAEKSLPELVNPVRRIQRLIDTFKSMYWNGGIRKNLTDSGLLHIDDAEEYGRNTGNWTRALKLAKQHSQSVRY